MTTSRTIKIVRQNVAGLATKENKLHRISNILVNEQLDVMVLTEVKKWKLKWTQFFEPMGYKVIESNRKDKIRGGVASLVRLEHVRAKLINRGGSTHHTYKITY